MEYVPHTPEDVRAMLRAAGRESIDSLFEHIPKALRLDRDLRLPPGLSEPEMLKDLDRLAARNVPAGRHPCFLGGGFYRHHIPTVVDHLAGRSEFYTAYTPYQPEASQGVLQAFFEFQTMVCELTGMEVANASHYDASTAAGEAALMTLGDDERRRVAVSRGVHPDIRAVIRTYLGNLDLEIVETDLTDGVTDPKAARKALDARTAGFVFQYPNFLGALEDGPALVEAVHGVGGKAVVIADPSALGILEPPGAYGADVVVGDFGCFGVPLQFGGPSVGYIATRDAMVRRMPGRLVGETVDSEGRRGYALTLETREQHIRREKASSNICTNVGLMALRSTIHVAALGRRGVEEMGRLCLQKAHYLHQAVTALPGVKALSSAPFFKEFAVRLPVPPAEVNRRLLERGILGGIDLGAFAPEWKNGWLLAVTELATRDDMDRLTAAVREATA